MSFSTCSAPSTACGSGMANDATLRGKTGDAPANTRIDVKQDSSRVKKGWEDELKDRIQVFLGTVHDFIDTLLPCSTPFVATPEVLNAFWAYNRHQGDEISSYPSLLFGLERIVASFPRDKRIAFVDTSDHHVPFPFPAFKDHHHFTKPDISVSFPGSPIPVKPRWEHISMVIEVKDTPEKDPFPRSGDKHVGTVAQLAKNARNLMLAHGFLCSFVVGIYGNIVRLARFDHSYALVSPRIDLRVGGAKLLQKFLWHFVHPLVGRTVVGNDPTMRMLDAESQEWIRLQLRKASPADAEKHLSGLDQGRRVEVYDEATGRCVPFLLYHLVDVNGRLFSRATMVWRAIEDTRVWIDGRLVPDPARTEPVKPRIVKEAWRQVVRPAETGFYRRLQGAIAEGGRIGLAKMAYGGDIGEIEMRWWQETQRCRASSHSISMANALFSTPNINPALTNTSSSVATPLFSSIGSYPPIYNNDAATPGQYPLYYPQHQTYSWRLIDEEYRYLERSHMRIVIDDVGRPLTAFKSTRELVEAVRDAIIGHRQAWETAGVLHRDVSLGNILILDNNNDVDAKPFVGFLHDFDYSSMEPDGAVQEASAGEGTYPDGSAVNRKERMGTYHFMAVELVSGEATTHDIHHDLESFYWILLWVILRHTECSRNGETGEQLWPQVFVCEDDRLAVGAKHWWIVEAAKKRLEIQDNPPLTDLMDSLTLCVSSQTAAHLLARLGHPAPVLTYDTLLSLIDKALADKERWPTNDWKRCTLLDRDARTVPQDTISLLAKNHTSEHAGPLPEFSATKFTPMRGVQSAPRLGTRKVSVSTHSGRPSDRESRPSKRQKTAMSLTPAVPGPDSCSSSSRPPRGRRGSSLNIQPVRQSPRITAKKAASDSPQAPSPPT
ncbi:hypothetical protein C8Q77DRAFT_1052469 [Trametes polyzona]|nr:hypothetical protein C8Q77DRAFT_1052469 [Trametes polyzona]